MIRHVSLDVWNTLVKPNPEYAERRGNYLNQICRHNGFDTGKTIYLEQKKRLDHLAEKEGISPSLYSNHLNLLTELGWARGHIDSERATQTTIDDFKTMFFKHSPFIDPRVETEMQELNRRGITLSITSNTNFIGGATLKEYFGTRFPLAFQIYSDQEGMAKPHPKLFEKVKKYAGYFHEDLQDNEIVHIGDHQICDVQGAKAVGMKGLHLSHFRDLHIMLKLIK